MSTSTLQKNTQQHAAVFNTLRQIRSAMSSMSLTFSHQIGAQCSKFGLFDMLASEQHINRASRIVRLHRDKVIACWLFYLAADIVTYNKLLRNPVFTFKRLSETLLNPNLDIPISKRNKVLSALADGKLGDINNLTDMRLAINVRLRELGVGLHYRPRTQLLMGKQDRQVSDWLDGMQSEMNGMRRDEIVLLALKLAADDPRFSAKLKSLR